MRKLFLIPSVLVVFVPALVLAHEVYVLDHASVLQDVAAASPNPLLAFHSNKFQFFFWGFVSFVTVSTIFCVSVFRMFERFADPLFWRLKRYAKPVARFTLGVCLIACAYNASLFGPELPFHDFVGASYVPALVTLFYIAGVMVILGWLTRIAALSVVPVFLLAIAHYGLYMLNYSNYLGEILFVLITGAGLYSIEGHSAHRYPGVIRSAIRAVEPYAFVILRVLFGVAVIFASVYAKFIHSALALDTITEYNLTAYFHFEPLFIVLGAFIIECLIGIFFIVGFEIRWTAIFFLFWLVLSLLYFGEAVWPHLILVGLNLTFLLHGYDRYSLEGRLFKRHGIEPVL